jgi:hypothetical protein
MRDYEIALQEIENRNNQRIKNDRNRAQKSYDKSMREASTATPDKRLNLS